MMLYRCCIWTLGIAGVLIPFACQTPEPVVQQAAPVVLPSLPPDVAKPVSSAIFEVVVPKLTDDTTKYERELPFDLLPFRERNERYLPVGTAFRIGPKRFVSAAHLFSAHMPTLWTDFSVRSPKGDVIKIGAFTRYSSYRDLVEFELEKDPGDGTFLQIADHAAVGEQVYVVGNAQGEGISYRGGQIASFTPEEVNGLWRFVRFSAPASPGNSGGPLLNANGQVVGVVVRKNQSENLNYAVPIQELDKLSTKQAEFLEFKLIGESAAFRKVHGAWQFTTKLPATYSEVAPSAQAALRARVVEGINALLSFSNANGFPDDEYYRQYLRHQEFGYPFGYLQKNSSGMEWSVHFPKINKILVADGQHVRLGTANGQNIAFVERPPGMALKDFLGQPQLIMDALLKAIPRARLVGAERVRITSVGAPASVTTWKDGLGRTWTDARWPLKWANELFAVEYLPTPNGAVCLVSFLNYGFAEWTLDVIRAYALILPISYYGMGKEWQEFLELDEKYRPAFFKGASISFKEKEGLRFSVGKYGLSLKAPDVTLDNEIDVMLGYSPTERLAPEVLKVKVFRSKGAFGVFPTFSQTDSSPDWAKTRWKDVMAKSAPYDGKAIRKQDRIEILRVLSEQWPDVSKGKASVSGRYVVQCDGPKDEKPELFMQTCEQFASDIKIASMSQRSTDSKKATHGSENAGDGDSEKTPRMPIHR